MERRLLTGMGIQLTIDVPTEQSNDNIATTINCGTSMNIFQALPAYRNCKRCLYDLHLVYSGYSALMASPNKDMNLQTLLLLHFMTTHTERASSQYSLTCCSILLVQNDRFPQLLQYYRVPSVSFKFSVKSINLKLLTIFFRNFVTSNKRLFRQCCAILSRGHSSH